MNNKPALKFELLGKALGRFEDMLIVPEETPGRVDATIQRFEFTFELFWKTMKQILESREGLETPLGTPRQVLVAAFSAGWIDDEELWVNMMKDRSLSSHSYNEILADQIMVRIQDYAPVLRKTYEFLAKID